ncbi:MAG: DUF4395 domain-containing protein, partial [Mycobacterium sp.]
MSSTTSSTRPGNGVPAQVDVRGPRFVAWVSTVVLIAAVLASAR